MTRAYVSCQTLSIGSQAKTAKVREITKEQIESAV